MLSIYEYAFKKLIKGKGRGAAMYIIYLTVLFSSFGGNIIKLFKFDYLQILSYLDEDIYF
jgi:hypothetical protein